MREAKYSENRQRGFTLLEVLIALLVLSIGLLGLAALQTTGLRSNQMASMRTTSTHLAYDISDRMRANPAGVEADKYVLVGGADPSGITVGPNSGEAVAKLDLVAWNNEVIALPGGRSSITQCDGSSTPACDGVTHIITVQWDEMRTGATGTTCPPVAKTDLRCYQLIFSE